MFSPSQTLSHYTCGNVVIWLSLAFQAGSINAGALLACHKFVSHTTSFATVFGTEVGQDRWFTGLRTHLTGLTTDLGIGLIRVLTPSHRLNTRKNEIRANSMRFGTIVAFSAGAGFSTIFYSRLEYWGFALPTLIALAIFNRSVFRFYHSETYLKSSDIPNYVEMKRAQ
jgi:hypothetical protein